MVAVRLNTRIRTAAVCALLFLGTVLLFSRVTRYGFINYDDPSYVTSNPHVQGGLSREGIVWAFTAPTDYWHPLTWLSHMLDWQLYGSAAFGHHLTSVVIHALNAVLVFLVFRRLTGEFWLSACAAAVFAWHPLRVESVAWVTERKDVLSGLLFLLTVLAYGRYVAARAAKRTWGWSYGLTLLCFVAGLMSKPMLVTVPVVLLILDRWPLKRSNVAWRARVIEKLPFFVAAAIVAAATIHLQRHEGAFVLDLPFGQRAGNAVVSISRYLGKLFWPANLIVCYPHPGHWPAPVVIAAAALGLAVTTAAWRQRYVEPWLLTGWLWFVVMLAPVIGLVQVGFQAMADRYSYLPLLGIEMALLWTFQAGCRTPSQRLMATIAVAALLGGAAVVTWKQESHWRDSVTLFEYAVAATNRNPVAEDFLASALFSAGRIDEAAAHAERATSTDPRNYQARVTLGGIRERQGRVPDAIRLYREALALHPTNPPVQMQLGLLRLANGQPDEARLLMAAGLRTDIRLLPRTLELARGALERRDVRTARFFYELLIAAAPDNAEAHVGLGSTWMLLGQRTAAVTEWRQAYALDPSFPGLREQLAALGEPVR